MQFNYFSSLKINLYRLLWNLMCQQMLTDQTLLSRKPVYSFRYDLSLGHTWCALIFFIYWYICLIPSEEWLGPYLYKILSWHTHVSFLLCFCHQLTSSVFYLLICILSCLYYLNKMQYPQRHTFFNVIFYYIQKPTMVLTPE